MFIPRQVSSELKRLQTRFPILALTGPRQAGKTTLLKEIFPGYTYLSLENPDIREHAISDPNGFLKTYPEKVIFDEAQRVPELFSYLQGIVDEQKQMGQFILSGSQNFLLLKGISQSLAGRVALLRIFPFTFGEIDETNSLENTIFRGFYPPIFDRDLAPLDFYPNYIETYLERDVQSMISPGNLRQFQTFMRLCAGHIGQLTNYSALADGCGISMPTAKEWLSILERSYILFALSPYYRNFNKRLVKTPKLYFYDTGLACNLLGIKKLENISTYYQKGSLMENLVIAELMKSEYHRGKRPAFYFWRDNHQNEVDLLWEEELKLNIMEIKYSYTLSGHFFKPLHKFQAMAEKDLNRKILVYGGEKKLLRDKVEVVGWKDLSDVLTQ